MKITLSSTQSPENYIAKNEKGQEMHISGNGNAPSPMQTVLMAMASCSAIDVEHILKKMRQPFEAISVHIEGEKQKEHPQVFRKVHMHYELIGDLKVTKVEKAIDLSLGKFCSVSQMIAKSAEITSSYDIIKSEKK